MKLNKKGYLIVEIIVASVIAMTMMYFLMEITIKIKDINEDYYVETKLDTDRMLMTSEIMEDVNVYYVTSIDIVNTDEIKSAIFTFSDGKTSKLEIIDNKFKYTKVDNSIYIKSFDSKLNIGNIELEKLCYNKVNNKYIACGNEIENGTDILASIVIEAKTIYSDIDYGLKLLIPYKYIGVNDNCLVTEMIDFDYTGSVKTYIAPFDGDYKLEVWGAQGGNTNQGGFGGYAKGIITLNKEAKLYLYVGGRGESSRDGGEATSIGIDKNNDGILSLYERIIVAGAGGGSCGWNAVGWCNGGAGGGTKGLNGQHDNRASGNATYVGKGGTQTAGGASGSNVFAGDEGEFGYGGSGGGAGMHDGAGSGGNGWYGGGGGSSDNDGSTGSNVTGGGGGSGFVLTTDTVSYVPSGYLVTDSKYYLTDAETIAGNEQFLSPAGNNETGHTGNGYARITYICDN